MSIEDLALSMNKGFKGVNKKIDNAVDLIDKLAASTLKGFESVEAKMATKEDIKIQEKVSEIILKEIKAIHEDGKSFRENISSLNNDGLSYDKKISNLTVRVEKLEIKAK